jgi:ferredoxin--NADP+ reductase
MNMQRLRGNVTYLPAISRPAEEPVPWLGATGHVQDVWKGPALAKAWGSRPSPEDSHIFLCGSPHMIDNMRCSRAEGFREHLEGTPGHVHVERYWHASNPLPAPDGRVEA